MMANVKTFPVLGHAGLNIGYHRLWNTSVLSGSFGYVNVLDVLYDFLVLNTVKIYGCIAIILHTPT